MAAYLVVAVSNLHGRDADAYEARIRELAREPDTSGAGGVANSGGVFAREHRWVCRTAVDALEIVQVLAGSVDSISIERR